MPLLKKNKKCTILGGLSKILMLIAASLLLISYVSMFFNPAGAWFLTVLGLLCPPLILLNIVFLIWSLVKRNPSFWFPLTALLPSVFIFGLYFQLPDKEEEEGNMKIISYNVGRFSMFSENTGIKSVSECADSVMSFLLAQDADIICIQEFAMQDSKAVKPYFEKRFKGYDVEYYVYPHNKGCYGNVTLSRFPLKNKGKLDFEKSSNLAIYCDYDINGVDLRVYNCHFQSYSISFSRLSNSLGSSQALKDTEEKVKKSIARRPDQVEMVIKDIEACPLESIVVGDFNDNPTSYTYYRLCKGREDTFVEAGRYLAPTCSYLQPFLRIDYILYPERYKAVKHFVHRLRYSDHFPVLAELKIGIND